MTIESQLVRPAKHSGDSAVIRVFGTFGAEPIDAEIQATVDWDEHGLATAQIDQESSLPAEVLEMALREIEIVHNRITRARSET